MYSNNGVLIQLIWFNSLSLSFLSIYILHMHSTNHDMPTMTNNTVMAGCLCTSVTLFASPFVIAVCRRNSPRLMAILGGLITALGCLFTSFATQFHQTFFAMGIFIGIGIAMIRDPSVVMIGQYFKKRRECVEIGLMSCYSLGISFMPLLITFCIRSVYTRECIFPLSRQICSSEGHSLLLSSFRTTLPFWTKITVISSFFSVLLEGLLSGKGWAASFERQTSSSSILCLIQDKSLS